MTYLQCHKSRAFEDTSHCVVYLRLSEDDGTDKERQSHTRRLNSGTGNLMSDANYIATALCWLNINNRHNFGTGTNKHCES